MAKKKKFSEKCIIKLNEMGLRVNNFERCYPGHWQRSSGAWVWYCEQGGILVGSCETLTDLFSKKCIKWQVIQGAGNPEIVGVYK